VATMSSVPYLRKPFSAICRFPQAGYASAEVLSKIPGASGIRMTNTTVGDPGQAGSPVTRLRWR